MSCTIDIATIFHLKFSVLYYRYSATGLKSRILVFFNDLVIIFLTTGTRDPKFGTDMKASLRSDMKI